MEQDNPVRKVQQHLRRAATLVSEQDFDAASREVDDVLALDPASLAAQAMKERIDAARARAVPALPKPSAPLTPELRPSDVRFVPSGIDAQSWLGFEARIQERRYRALMATIATAITNGDGLGARAALEEARELRPDGAELDALSARVALLPVSIPTAEMSASLWSRAFGGVAMLLVGIAFLVGIDWLRQSPEPAAQHAVVATPAPQPVAAPEVQGLAPVASLADTSARTADAPPSPAPAAPATIAPAPQVVGTSGVRRVDTPEESGSRVATAEESAAPSAPRPTFRTAERDESVPPDGEVPDDYVAAPPRREHVVAATPPPTPTPPPVVASPAAPYANVIRQPTPIVTPSLVTPPPAAAVVPTHEDEAQVQQVLRRYARAYGTLDATAAHAVWPSVDERALARAFSGLESQNVSFDSCDINVAGATANASCRGRASYVAKIGSREPRSEARTWNFELRRDGDGWRIENAEARRAAATN